MLSGLKSTRLKLGSMNKYILTIVIIIYFISCSIVDNNNQKVFSPYIHKFKGITIEGDSVSINEIKSNYVLLIFFDPNTCLNCLFESEYWNKLSMIGPQYISVIGITNNYDQQKIKLLDLKIPLIYDYSNSLYNMFTIDHPITKLLINLRTRTVVFIDYSHSEPALQKWFYEV